MFWFGERVDLKFQPISKITPDLSVLNADCLSKTPF